MSKFDPLDFAPLSWQERPLFDRPLCLSADAAALLGGEPGALGMYGDGEGDDGRPPYRVAGGVATIQVRGELVSRDSWLTRAFGVTTYEGLGAALRQAASDPDVRSIVLDIDSPGGEAAGAMETAELVRAVSERKPVVAFVNSLAASAAYWIACGASEIVATPMATLGSIGVVWVHLDCSAAFAKAGLKPTLLFAGAHKIDGAETHPLEPKAKARIQGQIDEVYDLFVKSVGKHRPQLGADGAKATKAGLYMGEKAVAAGLADRVAASPSPLAPGAARRGSAPPAVERRASSPATPVAAVSESRGETSPGGATSAAPAAAEEQAFAAAKAEGGAAVIARIAAIIECEEAKGRPKYARYLAIDTNVPLDVARALLASPSSEQQEQSLAGGDRQERRLGSRMARVPNPKISADFTQRSGDPQEDADAMWAELAAKHNAALPPGATIPAGDKRRP